MIVVVLPYASLLSILSMSLFRRLPSDTAGSYTMLCYVMTRILGTDGDAEGIQSPGVYCTSLGRPGGIEPARLTDAKPGTEGPRGTGVEGFLSFARLCTKKSQPAA